MINAFLQVCHNCPEVFDRTGAIAGLESMLGEIDKIKQESAEDIAERIKKLCDDYPDLAEAINANRKPKPKKAKVRTSILVGAKKPGFSQHLYGFTKI